MDKIILNKMAFYGYHGVFPEETRLGQRFMVHANIKKLVFIKAALFAL